MSLNKLGDFYLARGQSGDAEEALRCFQQSLATRQQLWESNPNSRGGGTCRCRSRSWGISTCPRPVRGCGGSLALLPAVAVDPPAAVGVEPELGQAARDVLVSHYKLGGFHRQAGNEAAGVQHLSECFAILDSFVREGRPMDPPMRAVYEH